MASRLVFLLLLGIFLAGVEVEEDPVDFDTSEETVSTDDPSEGQGRSHSTFVGYNESCAPADTVQCDPGKNIFCNTDSSTCECAIDRLLKPGANASAVYSSVRDKCFEISTRHDGWACEVDEQCWGSQYGELSRCWNGVCECHSKDGYQVVKVNDACLLKKSIGDSCTSNKDCQSIPGSTRCLGLLLSASKGICQCSEDHFLDERLAECLGFGYNDSPCKSTTQCQHSEGLGELSRCNEASKRCECWDTRENENRTEKEDAGLYLKKCFIKKGYGESCRLREECAAGYHEEAECLPHKSYHDEKVCRCPEGKECGKTSSGVMLGSSSLLMTSITIGLGLLKSFSDFYMILFNLL